MGRGEEELDQRLRRIRLVALDVDGVLTDGSIVYVGHAADGVQQLQAFDVQDGAALVWLRRAGLVVAWITGRGSPATAHRANELGVRELHTHAGPKDRVLAEVQAAHGIDVEETLAMGDDLPDLRMRTRAGVFCAPANARPEVRERSDLVTRSPGGRGAVREVAERLLVARGEWNGLLEDYLRPGD